MPVIFDGSDRLLDDPCSQRIKLAQNRATSQYQLSNMRQVAFPDTDVDQFAVDHRRLAWKGYGNVNSRKVDTDSKLRNDKIWTNTPWKTQLCTRTFTAVPDLSRGVPMPDTESRLINGQDTSLVKQCDPLSEKQYDVFHPTVMPVCVKHIVPDWTRGGDSSRDINRSPEFMRAMGYKYDGKMWVRNA